jgi:hypothetical protein
MNPSAPRSRATSSQRQAPASPSMRRRL